MCSRFAPAPRSWIDDTNATPPSIAKPVSLTNQSSTTERSRVARNFRLVPACRFAARKEMLLFEVTVGRNCASVAGYVLGAYQFYGGYAELYGVTSF